MGRGRSERVVELTKNEWEGVKDLIWTAAELLDRPEGEPHRRRMRPPTDGRSKRRSIGRLKVDDLFARYYWAVSPPSLNAPKNEPQQAEDGGDLGNPALSDSIPQSGLERWT